MKKKYTEVIKELTDKELLFHLYLTQVILFIISIILSLILFQRYSDFLSLFNINDMNILVIGGTAGIAVVLLDIILMKVLPSSYYDDGGLNVFYILHLLQRSLLFVKSCYSVGLFRPMLGL